MEVVDPPVIVKLALGKDMSPLRVLTPTVPTVREAAAVLDCLMSTP